MFEKTDAWQDEAKEEIEEIRKEATPKQEDPKAIAFPNPTKGQIEKIAAIERNVSKLGFDCGIRIIYLAEKDKFNKGMGAAMTGITRQFHSNNLNSFKPYGITFLITRGMTIKILELTRKKKDVERLQIKVIFLSALSKKMVCDKYGGARLNFSPARKRRANPDFRENRFQESRTAVKFTRLVF